jgi:protein TonB
MMLTKLTSIPTEVRLLLCLLVSAGIHGGLSFYEWVSHPPAVGNGQSAVVVALVPAPEDQPPAVVDPPKTLVEQSPAVKRPVAKAKSVSRVASRPAVKPLPVTPPKPGLMVEATEIIEESAECMHPDPACAEPTEDLPELSGEVAPIGMSTQESLVSPPDDNQSADQNTSGQTDRDLIEAMPNYRNNPLPEYPYIARQRHWQGVVWLLVDVSSKGLVVDVDLESSSGYRVLDRAARRAVKRWQFTPATRAGLPVDSQVRIPVRFSLEDS